MCSQNKLNTMLTTLQRILFFVPAVLLISESTGMVTTHDVFTRRGDTIRLNCSGVHQNRLWRGPVQTNKAKNTLYFDGLQKNHKLTLNNVNLDEDQATKKYNLVISNLTTQNVGVYSCIIPTSQGFTKNVFRVSFESAAGDVSLSTQNTPIGDTNSADQKNQHLIFLVCVGLPSGLCFIVVSIALFYFCKKHPTLPNLQPNTLEEQYDEINYNIINSDLLIRQTGTDIVGTADNRLNSIQVQVLAIEEEDAAQQRNKDNFTDDGEKCESHPR